METLSDQIAVAVANARLHESMQRELAERQQVEKALQLPATNWPQRVEERTTALRRSKNVTAICLITPTT